MRRPLLALAALSLSCSSSTVVNATYNFSRASDVEFVCLQSDAGRVNVLPLARCGINPADNTSSTGNAHLYALVTQAERGELAVVDLAASSGTSILDNSPDVPGYSFIPLGAIPTSIVSDARDNNTGSVWVASAGDRTIERLDASTLLYNPRRASDAGREVVHTATRVAMNGAPRDLAIDTVDGRTLLYATVPDRAAVAVLDITNAAAPVDLGFTPVTVPAANADAGLDAGSDDAGTGSAPAHPQDLVVDPETHRVYVSDDGSNYVHVFAGNPLREVDRIAVGAPTRAITLTGWARRLTCAAEADDPDHYGRARYLYATEASTGLITVYDLTRGAVVRPNVLPAPNPQRRMLAPARPEDRVALATPAVALFPINTAEYRGRNAAGEITVPDACRTLNGCGGTGALGPTYLHGVFVGALLRTGRIAIIDVDDYDAPARAKTPNIVGAPNGYRFVRHAPRPTVDVSSTNLVVSTPTLTALVRGTQRVSLSEAPETPALGCATDRSLATLAPCASTAGDAGVDGGSAGLGGITVVRQPRVPTEYLGAPDADGGTVPMAAEPACAAGADAGTDAAVTNSTLADPYAVLNETWTLTWEGAIPNLDLYGVSFTASGANAVMESPATDFCARGALADDTYARDQVTVLGDPTSLASDRVACGALFGTGAQPLNRDFVLDDAFRDRLVLRPNGAATAADVARCFALAAHVQVRARRQWMVTGNVNGYLSAVRADASGHCEVDPAKQSAVEALASRCAAERNVTPAATTRCLAGRACMASAVNGVVARNATPMFANPFFCVQVFPPLASGDGGVVAADPTRDTQFTFSISGAWEPSTIEAAGTGSFPMTGRFLPTVGRMYVVDSANSGLIEFSSVPISRIRVFN